MPEAEPLFRRALAIDEASYGPDHPNVAIRLNNLAELLQPRTASPRPSRLMRRALAIDEASYGPDHPNVAIDLNNLARLLKATNRLGEAEPLMRRALAIDEASYGPDHPNVASASTISRDCSKPRTASARPSRLIGARSRSTRRAMGRTSERGDGAEEFGGAVGAIRICHHFSPTAQNPVWSAWCR